MHPSHHAKISPDRAAVIMDSGETVTFGELDARSNQGARLLRASGLAIGDRVDTGTWYQNRCDFLDPALAWTGVKLSGRGCTLSALGYEALTRPKSFHLRTKTQG